jgi:ABC-type sugar transport system ATPase subunit
MSVSLLPPRWALTDIVKRYPGVLASDHVTLELRSGEIHGLLGENGCGKSTLIRILSGVERPDAGQIAKDGIAISFDSPLEARRAGIATVFQEFSLVPELSVAENIALGSKLPTTKLGTVDWRRIDASAAEVLAELGMAGEIDARLPVSALSVAQQQLVEIAKAISARAETLILDEPTAALSEKEIERLHDLLRTLKARGQSILYVSHRLDEVVSVVDVVTILKDGRRVSAPGEIEIAIVPIVSAMIGADIETFYPPRGQPGDEVVLSVSGLDNQRHFTDVSFELRRGEILGIAGSMGSGRSSLLRTIFGVHRPDSGSIRLHGKPYLPSDTNIAVGSRFALVPENRKTDGLFFNFSGPENASIAALSKIGAGPLLSRRKERRGFSELSDLLKFSRNAAETPVRSLSGGNQQKIVLSRWLFADAEVFLLDEPTQGIDVGAKKSMYELLRQLAANGRSVVLVSSDFEELIAMSDTIRILRDGRLGPALPAAGLTARELAVAAAGGTEPRAAMLSMESNHQ